MMIFLLFVPLMAWADSGVSLGSGTVLILILLLMTSVVFYRQKKSSQKQREEIEYLQAIFNIQRNIVIVTDGSNLMDANRSFFEFFDSFDNLESFLRQHHCICEFFEVVSDDPEYAVSALKNPEWVQYLLDNPLRDHKVKITRKDRVYHFLLHARHLDSEGRTRYVVNFQNISDLERSRKQFQEMFQKHSAVMLIIDPVDGTVIDANHAARHYYGYTSEELRTLRINQIDIGNQDDGYHEGLGSDSLSASKQTRHRLKHGEIKDVEVHATPIRYNEQVYLFAIVHDISERVRLERQMQDFSEALEQQMQQEIASRLQSEIKYKQLFDSIPGSAFVYHFDSEGWPDLFIEANPTATEMLGFGREELMRLRIQDLANLESCDESEKLRVGSLENQRVRVEMRFVTKDSKMLDVEIYSHMFDYFNRPTAFSIVRDITVEKKLREHQRAQEKLLIQQSKMAEMGNMIGVIAHQWKQPLSVINLMAESALDEVEMGEEPVQSVRKAKDKIEEQVRFLGQTITDFRHFFKPEKKKRLFDVQVAIERITGIIQPLLEKSSTGLGLDIQEYLQVYGYENEFKQVVLNLVNNAGDAIAENGVENGQIQVSAYAEGEETVIEVTDNGGGIPDHLLPDKLFDPYVSTKGEKGTGIGLSMSKTIIEQNMGGEITAENIDGGSKITVRVPSKELKESAKEKKYGTVLYVEDNEFTRKHMSNLFARRFEEVLQAENGKQALEVFAHEKEQIGLIITDIAMPEVNGVELGRAIKKVDPKMPIIALTSLKEEVFEDIGFAHIFEKPLNAANLFAAVDGILGENNK